VYESPVSWFWGPAASLWVCLFVADSFPLPLTVVHSGRLLPRSGAVSIFLSIDYIVEWHHRWACSAHPAGRSAVVAVTVEALLRRMYASKLYRWLGGFCVVARVAPSSSCAALVDWLLACPPVTSTRGAETLGGSVAFVSQELYREGSSRVFCCRLLSAGTSLYLCEAGA